MLEECMVTLSKLVKLKQSIRKKKKPSNMQKIAQYIQVFVLIQNILSLYEVVNRTQRQLVQF